MMDKSMETTVWGLQIPDILQVSVPTRHGEPPPCVTSHTNIKVLGLRFRVLRLRFRV